MVIVVIEIILSAALFLLLVRIVFASLLPKSRQLPKNRCRVNSQLSIYANK